MPSRKSDIGSMHSGGNSTKSSCYNGPMSSDGSEGISSHSSRLQEVRQRMEAFETQTRSLASHIASGTPALLTVSGGHQELVDSHDIALQDVEEYGNVTQSNLPSISLLQRARYATSKRPLYVHVIKLAAFPEETKAQLLGESLKILKYFRSAGVSNPTDSGSNRSSASSHRSSTSSSSTGVSSASNRHHGHFLRLIEIFLMEAEQQVLVVEEKFPLENSMQQYLWNGVHNGPGLKAATVKRWAIKVAEAMEVLNVAGVVHRFLRPENIIMSSSREKDASPKVAAFDCAVLYWNAETQTTVPLAKGLPFPELKGSHLFDHLPPESFTDGYDGSSADAWSVGALICRIATGSTPFAKVVAAVTSAERRAQSGSPPPSVIATEFIEAWKRSKERLWMAEELRSLLDDVFTEADVRITLWEMARDFRLSCKDTREFVKKKAPPYYRIDILKNLNTDGPPEKSGRPPSDAAVSSIDGNTFHEQSAKIFKSEGYVLLREGPEAAITGYRVLRDLSFTEDLGPEVILNDHYLKAVKVVQQLQPVSENTVRSVISVSGGSNLVPQTSTNSTNALVKIVSTRHIPVAHRNMLLNESSKIMRHCGANESSNARVHRVLDIYFISDAFIYIFFEPLEGMRSLATIIGRLQEEGAQFPPPMRLSAEMVSLGSNCLTLTKLQTVMRDLAQTATYLAQHGLAHRYIRPEYVFVNEQDYALSKLTHFDLACFVWNPEKSILIKRSRGIQDRLEHLWSHLPPECYESMYDTRLVDVWSIGTLLAYCLTGVMPFGAGSTANITLEQALNQWALFKSETHSHVFGSPIIAPVTELLTKCVFVGLEERIKAEQLAKKLASQSLFRDRPRRSAEAVGAKGSRSSSRPTSRGNKSKQQHTPKTSPRHTGKTGKVVAHSSKVAEPKMKQSSHFRKQTKK